MKLIRSSSIGSALAIAITFALVTSRAGLSAAPGYGVRNFYGGPYHTQLCKPVIPLPKEPPVRTRGYLPEDELFRSGNRGRAFQGYYQRFFCRGSALYQGLDPRTERFGADHGLDDGLWLAYGGHYALAVKSLLGPAKENTEFGDGLLILGEFEWAAGDRVAATTYWKAAENNPGFTQAPDGRVTPNFVYSARYMLAFARKSR